MNQLVCEADADLEAVERDDPFRYGWRYVRRTLPDGSQVDEQVPLSWEDLLFPEEDDFVVQKPPHLRDLEYFHLALSAYFAGRDDVVVLGDCRVDWGVAGVRPMGPDVTVLFGVTQWLQHGTFRVAEEGGQPVLVVEVTSPSTRDHDLFNKPALFYRAGVQRYVIVDRGPHGESPAQLLGYQRGTAGWVPLPLDARGRLDLSPVGLQLEVVNDYPWLYDAKTGHRLPSPAELGQALQQETRARVEAEARAQQEARARADAEARAQQETRARARLEERIRELESLLRSPKP